MYRDIGRIYFLSHLIEKHSGHSFEQPMNPLAYVKLVWRGQAEARLGMSYIVF